MWDSQDYIDIEQVPTCVDIQCKSGLPPRYFASRTVVLATVSASFCVAGRTQKPAHSRGPFGHCCNDLYGEPAEAIHQHAHARRTFVSNGLNDQFPWFATPVYCIAEYRDRGDGLVCHEPQQSAPAELSSVLLGTRCFHCLPPCCNSCQWRAELSHWRHLIF